MASANIFSILSKVAFGSHHCSMGKKRSMQRVNKTSRTRAADLYNKHHSPRSHHPSSLTAVIAGMTGLSSGAVVAAAAFWINFCVLGVLRSNAVLFSALLRHFGSNREEAAWHNGVFGFFMCLTGALSGFLTHHLGIRALAVSGAILSSASVSMCALASHMHHITFFYGAVQGIGVGLLVPLTHVVVNRHFRHYKALALGVAYSGSSMGSFVFPPLVADLIAQYSLDGTFLILGAIMLNALPAAMLYNDKNLDSGPSCTTSQVKPSFQVAVDVLSSPHFLIISAAYAIYFSTSAIFLMVALDFAKDRGVSPEEGLFLVPAYSAGDLAGRILVGWVSDSLTSRGCLVRLCLLGLGLLCCGFSICPGPWLLAASSLAGFLGGGLVSNHSVLLGHALGQPRLPVAVGFSTCFVGIVAFFRPVLIGFFRDRTKSYDYMFMSLGVSMVTISFIWTGLGGSKS